MTIEVPNFTDEELHCRCGCGMQAESRLIFALQALRDRFGAPMPIDSTARCPAHNKKEGGKSQSKHLLGIAADVLIPAGTSRERLIRMADAHGFNGIGRYPWGLHLDLREHPARWEG